MERRGGRSDAMKEGKKRNAEWGNGLESEYQYQVYKVFIIKIKLNTESLKLDFTV